MDLKPWQCGLCKFKSMLRPEVVEHCSKVHNSKMQYKCACCPFRASTLENVTKHQSTSHVGNIEEIFYYYYREGSIPDEPDGTPRWMKQHQKIGNPDSIVKTEISSSPTTSVSVPPLVQTKMNSTTTAVPVDLNLVKQEVPEPEINPDLDLSIETLCNKFGQFCEPNGLKFRCPLCKVVTEDSDKEMESHLFEELNYRKWGCSSCTYKAFHKTGLNEHMLAEHRQTYVPVELPPDIRIEKWVAGMLQHQRTIIEKNKESLIQQRVHIEKSSSVQSIPGNQQRSEETNIEAVKKTPSMKDLELAFGQFGVPSNMNFCCPKCQMKCKEESTMQDHLESELTKIRWCCSNCPTNFCTYHEAQFHCKSVHDGQSSRPIEAIRDPEMRSAWIAAVIRVQKLSMNYIPVSETNILQSVPSTSKENASEPEGVENSLLVVRYEERVPTPEGIVVRRTRLPPVSPDSDDDKLVIDEPASENTTFDTKTAQLGNKKCPYCKFVSSSKSSKIRDHILRHYGLKPFNCAYCNFNAHKATVINHLKRVHRDKVPNIIRTTMPSGPPTDLLNTSIRKSQQFQKEDSSELICLTCNKALTMNQCAFHSHDNIKPEFAKSGDIVVKCSVCLLLFKDGISLRHHHNACHPNTTLKYVGHVLYEMTENKQTIPQSDLKTNNDDVEKSLQFENIVNLPIASSSTVIISDEEIDVSYKRKTGDDSILPTAKRVAKKSTTKLPKVFSVAKKSTTKLPFDVDSDSDDENEYSYYGTKPTSLDDLSNVTTNMPFCNTTMPFTLKKLNEFIRINPKVIVKDVKKC